MLKFQHDIKCMVTFAIGVNMSNQFQNIDTENIIIFQRQQR